MPHSTATTDPLECPETQVGTHAARDGTARDAERNGPKSPAKKIRKSGNKRKASGVRMARLRREVLLGESREGVSNSLELQMQYNEVRIKELEKVVEMLLDELSSTPCRSDLGRHVPVPSQVSVDQV